MDIIIFSGEDWTNFSQRTQSLAIEFAESGNRVFYIQPMLSAAKLLSNIVNNDKKETISIKNNNIILLKPYLALVSFRGSYLRYFDKMIFKNWFKSIRKKYNISSKPILLINMPYWWNNIIDKNMFSSYVTIYDCIDDCLVYSRNKRINIIMEKSENQIIKDSDLIFTTAKPLFDKIVKISDKVELLSNGVNIQHFVKSNYIKPTDIQNIKKPIFGFIGALYHWIDFDFFEYIANINKEWSILLIGPTNRESELNNLIINNKNIYYLKTKPYSLIPDYLYYIDVCLNPFKTDSIGENVNPLKLYEYLSMGKPVISSKTKEMENFSELVYLYSNYSELNDLIQKAIKDSENQFIIEKRIEFANKNSWKIKADRILNKISTL